MPEGPSKYDDLVAQILQEQNADAVVVLVLGGKKGHGVGCKVRTAGDPLKDAAKKHRQLALVLRNLADNMDLEAQTFERLS